MRGESFCDSCSTDIPVSEIFDHVESCVIGTRPAGSLYDISCGDCQFKTCGVTGNAIIDHISRTQHSMDRITLRWEHSMEKEAARIRDIVKIGLGMLPDQEKKPACVPNTKPSGEEKQIKDKRSMAEIDLKRKLQEIREAKRQKASRHNNAHIVSQAKIQKNCRPKAKKSIRTEEDVTRSPSVSSIKVSRKRVNFADTIQSIPNISRPIEQSSEETGMSGMLKEELRNVFPKTEETNSHEQIGSEDQSYPDASLASGNSYILDQNSVLEYNHSIDASNYGSMDESELQFIDESRSYQNYPDGLSGYDPAIGTDHPDYANRKKIQSGVQLIERWEDEIQKGSSSFVRCHLCEIDLPTKKSRAHTEVYLLSHFTCTHSGVNIIRCSACYTEFQTWYRWRTHQEKTPCIGEKISLRTDELVNYFREMLNRCFPGWDFEHALGYSPYLGAVETRKKPKIKAVKRSKEPKKGDCHLCDRDGINDFHHQVSHVLGHTDLKLFECTNCSARYRNPSGIKYHQKSAKHPTCDGTYVTKETEEDILKIRNTLKKAFPEFDWDKELEADRKFNGLKL